MSSNESMLGKYYDEIEVGDRFVSHGRTVTETDIVMWCTMTGDMFRIHTDRHYAETTRFGQRVAAGLMINAWMAGLGVPPAAPGVIANYGTNKLRFTAPVFISDTIHLEAEVIAKEEKKPGENGLVTLQWNAVNHDGVTVMASELVSLIAFRPKD